MRILINTAILTFVISALITACTGKNNKDSSVQQLPEDSVSEKMDEHIRGHIVEDTVIGHWNIKTCKGVNDIIVGNDNYKVRDSSVFITLNYDNRKLFSNKEIQTKDLVGSEGKYMMQWGGRVFWSSASTLYLSFGCFLPDTDDGWDMLYQILPDGKSNIIIIETGLGIDGFYVVAEFMALYFNERAAGASAVDLKRLFYHYCTKDVAEKLSAGTIEIVSANTDFRHADRTTQINSLDESIGGPLEEYSFQVEFKPKSKDKNITDGLVIEVDGTLNKISNIESGYRKVI